MRKFFITLAIAIVAVALLIGAMTISYMFSADYQSDKFTDMTIVNGIDCSGLTYKEAASKLSKEWNGKTIIVMSKLGEPLDEYSDFGCTYNIYGQLESLKTDHKITQAINHYLHLPLSATIPMNVVNCSDDFSKRISSSEFLSRGSIIETKDAYVDMVAPDFPIIPEVYGNTTDIVAYKDDLLKSISMGDFIFEYDENTYISAPSIKADDPELIEFQSFCRKYLNQKITYELGKETFTIPVEDLYAMMNKDHSGEPNEEAVAKFVAKLKEKYDIIGGEVKVTSLTGKTFKVSNGYYGWVIDEFGEAEQLTADISSHKDVKREPVFSQRGNGEYSKTFELGKTYIDADLTEQHVIYFENGVKKFECDCVSGNQAAGHNTPTGIFNIKDKRRGVTLTSGGKKKDPGYYSSYVNYWIPFLGNNYGLHDASWRSNFGGEIYKTAGSHGCINLPPNKAGQLYNLIDVGTLLIVHY
ncbi:MAG: L,D-transpeptidase family protein [Bacillota bacterium]|nr:L,D-transpeptidase family protein [Bacillota bacterium]